jgi:MFS family permease
MDDSQEHRILTEPLLSSADSCIRDVASQDDLTNTKISESERTEASTVTVEEDDLEEPNNEYVLDPSRFAVLGVFSLANVLASAAWITFAPIDDVIMEMYDISLQKVNWLSLIFMALYGPGTAVCAWAIRIYGLRMTVVVSAIVMALGGMLRWWSVSFVHENHHGAAYAILLIGQGLIAMAQPVVSNAPARVASAWFQQTAGAIGFVVFGSMVGLVLGQSMSPWMMGSINALLAGQALAMVVCSIATIVYFKSEPKSPPTLAEALRRRQTLQGHQTRDPEHHQPNQSSSTSIWFEMKLLLSDTQYLVLLLSFGIGYGVNNGKYSLAFSVFKTHSQINVGCLTFIDTQPC